LCNFFPPPIFPNPLLFFLLPIAPLATPFSIPPSPTPPPNFFQPCFCWFFRPVLVRKVFHLSFYRVSLFSLLGCPGNTFPIKTGDPNPSFSLGFPPPDPTCCSIFSSLPALRQINLTPFLGNRTPPLLKLTSPQCLFPSPTSVPY